MSSISSTNMNVKVNIFFIHYQKLVNREVVMEKAQTVFNAITKSNRHIEFNTHKILKHDPSDLKEEAIKRIFDNTDLLEGKDNTFYNMFKLPRPQNNLISNSLKHFEALSVIAKTSSVDDVNIILEDDIMIDANFKDKLEYFILNKVYKDFDCIFLCLPSPGPPTANETESIQERKPIGHLVIDKITDSKDKVVPSCDSYFVSTTGAQKMASGYMPIRFQHNIQLSFIFDKLKLNVGRCIPNISIDGSKIGEYPSTLSPNNILLYNVLFKTIYKTLEKEVITHEEIDQMKKLFLENPLKNKADFLFLQGLFYLRFKEYSSCKELFDKAIEMYEDNFSPLNHQSAIIQNYIELSKHIQDIS